MIALFAVLWWIVLSAHPGSWAAEPLGSPRSDVEPSHPGTDWLDKALGSLSETRMLDDVGRLSGSDFNGRQTGTADDLRSGLFVAERFATLRLQPAGSETVSGTTLDGFWAQSETTTVSNIVGSSQMDLSAGSQRRSARLGADYVPVLDSPSVNATAPVFFVGYGISDPAGGFDEYAGLDVRGRIVLFLRGKPEGYKGPAGQADKIRTAREKGAVAFLTVTGPVLSPYESRRGMTGAPMASYGTEQLPGAWITPALADDILATSGRTLRRVQERLNQSLVPQSVMINSEIHLAWERIRASGRLLNVLGIIRGRDTNKGQETVLIGAHRDHFGRQAGLLFPGADDNASGTSILLEVARVLSESAVKPKHSILFVSFSGEEQGLLGSRLYVGYPAVPLERTVAMINVDHAGIGNGRLTVGVTGLPKERAAEAGRLADVAGKLDLFGFFPGGDHVPFKESGIPTVTVVSGGPHPHFHQPSDTAGTVTPDILRMAARYVLAMTWLLANAER